jgi:protein phosphatase
MSAFVIHAAALTDIGQRRSHNEDYFAIVDLDGQGPGVSSPARERTLAGRGAVLVVADGIGGAPEGEVASEMAANVIQFQLTGDALPDAAEPPGERLRRAIEAANHEIHAYARTHDLRGMGTTLTAVAIADGRLDVGHVGDSRAYLLRGGTVEQLTRDHTLAQYLVELGRITPEDAAASEQRHVLIQAIGPMPEVIVEVASRPVEGGDVLVLCSDGLWEYLDAEELGGVVASAPDLASAAQRMVALANERGGADNITVVLARVTAPASRGSLAFPGDGR